MVVSTLLANLLKSLSGFTWGNALMLVVGAGLIAAGAFTRRRALLLIPAGFGCILANLGASGPGSTFQVLSEAGLQSGVFPILILAGLGTALDFRPLLRRPRMVLLAAAGQLGIYIPLILATLLGYSLGDAASIGMIGAMNWPAAVFVASRLSPGLLPLIALLAYIIFALAASIRQLLAEPAAPGDSPITQPVEETDPPSGWVLAAFPVGITILAGVLAPPSAPLVGGLMLGNLLRIAGQNNRLLKIVQNELTGASLLLLGLAAGSGMSAGAILSAGMLKALLLALIALMLNLLGGMLACKLAGGRLSDLLPAGGDAGTGSGEPSGSPDFPASAYAAVQVGAVLSGGVLLAVLSAAG